jgi:hypothetical protein
VAPAKKGAEVVEGRGGHEDERTGEKERAGAEELPAPRARRAARERGIRELGGPSPARHPKRWRAERMCRGAPAEAGRTSSDIER